MTATVEILSPSDLEVDPSELTLEEMHPNYIDEEDFDHDAYDSSLSNRLKQGWIVFQACLMTIYMIIGVRAYRKLGVFWSR